MVRKNSRIQIIPAAASVMTAALFFFYLSFFENKEFIFAQSLPPAAGEIIHDKNTGQGEIWGYLLEGHENAYTGSEPITDLCYFRSIINYRGELVGAYPIPASVPVKPGLRKHLVVAELSNPALERFILSERYPLRKQLLKSIVKNSAPYDGVQIDFESVPSDSRDEYLSFLADLKKKISPKILSVAIPARTRFVKDAYDYEALSAVADRIIVMAYDEHWSTGEPGPIASFEWCGKIVQYAAAHIPADKLVMGVPLYGRMWRSHSYSKEISYDEALKISEDTGKAFGAMSDGYPFLEYEQKVKVFLYFENNRTIKQKVDLYGTRGIRRIAFWRLGQEPGEFWKQLTPTAD